MELKRQQKANHTTIPVSDVEKHEEELRCLEEELPAAEEQKVPRGHRPWHGTTERLIRGGAQESALEMLGLRYAEVLKANLAVKFSHNTKPFDETAFYETVYKFVSHTIRHAHRDFTPAPGRSLHVHSGSTL